MGDAVTDRFAELREAVGKLGLPEPSPLLREWIVNGWQPIETAPRDGTWVLVYGALEYSDEGDVTRQAVAQFTETLNARKCNGRWAMAWYDGGYYGMIVPSHWMPLPPPPEG